MLTFLSVIVAIGCVWALFYHYASLLVWTVSLFAALVIAHQFSDSMLVSTMSAIIFLAITIPLNVYPIRRALISKGIFALFRKYMPSISKTERDALEAGTIGWEGELFAGRPKWKRLLSQPAPTLTQEEKDFLEGPVNELCSTINDWDITHNLTDLPPEMWSFIKKNGFFGMIIPKEYGGKGFTATAIAEVLVRVYGRSITAATTIGVPNSLGPAELLLVYGTPEQKEYYLPRLASGKEIPCFALTGPTAGSDAGSIPDTGIVCKGKFKGKEVIGLRLNWDKRYITLAPVATLIGLAFKMYDPDHLLGDQEDIGISCALIPANTKGVTTGRRHFPLNTGFMNGPTQGKDVFLPLDCIIGGEAMAGNGWRMLMECLGAGRAISLPTSAVGGQKACVLATGAYSRIRKQFNTPIGYFEGIEEPLARMAGYTYMCDAGLKMTATAIDLGAKPSVASAILKYHTTELGRAVTNDAMDIHGGKGICLGPKNYLGRGHQNTPISITVEGANILTRSLIIFGQGAMRCHPFVFEELEGVLNNDLKRFDKALFGHIGFMISTKLRALFLSLSAGWCVRAPEGAGRRYYQYLTRYSSALAFASEVSMLFIGSDLKRREKISARLGDVLSYLYLASASLKKFEDDGRPSEDVPVLDWVCQDLLYKIQQSLDGVIRNFPSRLFAFALRGVIFPLGRRLSAPSDQLGHKVARLLLSPTKTRDRITQGVYKEAVATNPIGCMEEVLVKAIALESLEKKVSHAVRDGRIQALKFSEQVNAAAKLGLIDASEAKALLELDALRLEVISVDDFSHEQLARLKAIMPLKQEVA